MQNITEALGKLFWMLIGRGSLQRKTLTENKLGREQPLFSFSPTTRLIDVETGPRRLALASQRALVAVILWLSPG
jgi:hypothetical protein